MPSLETNDLFLIPQTIAVTVTPILDSVSEGRSMYGLNTVVGCAITYEETSAMVESLVSITPEGLLNIPTDAENIRIVAKYHGNIYTGTFDLPGFDLTLALSGDSPSPNPGGGSGGAMS